MKNLILFVVFILALVLVQFAQAQTVDEIINRHLGVRGGIENLRGLQTLVIQGTKQSGDTLMKIKSTLVQGKLIRSDYQMDGDKGFMVVTRKEGWNLNPASFAKVEPLTPERVKYMQADLDIAGPLVDYALKGIKVEFVKGYRIDDSRPYAVKATLANGKEIIHIIDRETYQLRQTFTIENINGQREEYVTEFADWKKVKNIMFPHSIKVLSGPDAGTLTIDAITVNEYVKEGNFLPQ